MATMSANEVSLSRGATVWIGINAHHERPTVTAAQRLNGVSLTPPPSTKAIGRANVSEFWPQFKASAEYHPLV